MTEAATHYLKKLEDMLVSDFAATGESLSEKLASIRNKLPDELAAGIENLAQTRLDDSDPEADTGFVFRCGQLAEQLRAVLLAQAAESVASAHPDGLNTADLAPADLDAVARFMAARDRFMRAVANFTLKALLISAGLLIVGLALGIV